MVNNALVELLVDLNLNSLGINRLHTIPEGLVILAGHSLGGFLTADAAIEGARMRALRQRIVGMIAFDVPFLGGCFNLTKLQPSDRSSPERFVNFRNPSACYR